MPDKALVFHLKTKQFGATDITVQATLNYVSAGYTIDGLTALSATIDGLSSYSFDSAFWLVGGRSLSAFNSSHQLQSITGPSLTSSMTTGEVGDDSTVSLLSAIRLRFAPGYKPTTANVQTYTKMELGDSPTTGSSGSMTNGRFDVLDSSRWHSATVSFTGDHRVMAMDASLTPEGEF